MSLQSWVELTMWRCLMPARWTQTDARAATAQRRRTSSKAAAHADAARSTHARRSEKKGLHHRRVRGQSVNARLRLIRGDSPQTVEWVPVTSVTPVCDYISMVTPRISHLHEQTTARCVHVTEEPAAFWTDWVTELILPVGFAADFMSRSP